MTVLESWATTLTLKTHQMNLASRAKGFASVVDIEIYRGALSDERRGKVPFGGRSMGARAAVMAAQSESEESSSNLLVLASYPLVGPKSDLRDEILLSLPASTCVLFISGDRDNMCPLSTLNDVRSKMVAKTWLVTVQGADHGMRLRARAAGEEATAAVGIDCARIAALWLKARQEGQDKDADPEDTVVRWDGEAQKIVIEGQDYPANIVEAALQSAEKNDQNASVNDNKETKNATSKRRPEEDEGQKEQTEPKRKRTRTRK